MIEDNVLSFADCEHDYQTAQLGNALREICNRYREALYTKTEDALQPIHSFLLKLVIRSDEDILRIKLSIFVATGRFHSRNAEAIVEAGKPRHGATGRMG